jgi:metallothionein
MTEYARGTVLTCSHSDCDCRVRIESECRCSSDTASPYVCMCGAPMVEVTEESNA